MARARPFLFLQILFFFFFFFSLRFTFVCHRAFRANLLLRADLLRHTCNSCMENYDRVCCLFFFDSAIRCRKRARCKNGNQLRDGHPRDEKWNFIGQYVNFPRTFRKSPQSLRCKRK